jgi:hypothetical protein
MELKSISTRNELNDGKWSITFEFLHTWDLGHGCQSRNPGRRHPAPSGCHFVLLYECMHLQRKLIKRHCKNASYFILHVRLVPPLVHPGHVVILSQKTFSIRALQIPGSCRHVRSSSGGMAAASTCGSIHPLSIPGSDQRAPPPWQPPPNAWPVPCGGCQSLAEELGRAGAAHHAHVACSCRGKPH